MQHQSPSPSGLTRLLAVAIRHFHGDSKTEKEVLLAVQLDA